MAEGAGRARVEEERADRRGRWGVRGCRDRKWHLGSRMGARPGRAWGKGIGWEICWGRGLGRPLAFGNPGKGLWARGVDRCVGGGCLRVLSACKRNW